MKCPPPKIENSTKVWEQHDKMVLEEAQKNCKRFYGDNYCIKVIEKTGENAYRVTCFIPPVVKTQGEK